MIRLLAAGLAFGLGFGAVRNAPPLVDRSPAAFVLVLVLTVVSVFFAGRWTRTETPGLVAAAAYARSEANAQGGNAAVNVFFGGPDSARLVAQQQFGGLDRAEWASTEVTALERAQLAAEESAGQLDQVGGEIEPADLLLELVEDTGRV